MSSRLFALVAFLMTFAFAQPAPAAAPDLGTARLSWQPGPDTPQIAQAIDKGLFTKRGITVKTSSTPTGREALEALIGGQVDYALMAELPPVIGAMQKRDFRVISTISRYGAGRIIGTATTDPSSLKNLNGKKIGTTIGTNVDFQAYLVLHAAGVRATMVNVGPADLSPALARGDIDAAFMFPSFYAQAKKLLGDRYREHITPEYQSTFVLVASLDEVSKHPDRVKAMLSALVEANKLVVKDQAESAAVVSKATGGLIAPADLVKLWADYKFDIVLDKKLVQLFDLEGHWVHENGFVKGDAPTVALFLGYVDPSFLNAVAPANVRLK